MLEAVAAGVRVRAIVRGGIVMGARSGRRLRVNVGGDPNLMEAQGADAARGSKSSPHTRGAEVEGHGAGR